MLKRRQNRAAQRSADTDIKARAATTPSMDIESAKAASQEGKPKRTVWLFLAAMGPGIVAAMAGNDAGGISTYSLAGAEFGYSTLWTIPIMMFFLIVVQESAARMGAKTGKGFSALIRERFGIRLTAFAMAALLTANAATTLSEFAGVAAGMELFGVSKYLSVPVAGLAVWLLIVGGSYKRVEKIFLAISCVFITYIAAAFLAGPDWVEVTTSTFIPHIEFEQAFFSIIIASIGTTIAPWMMFFTQNNVVDKGVTIKDLFFQRIDVISGAVVACLVAWFIIITTGTVLFPQGIAVVDAAGAANALAPIAGDYARQLFAVGLVAASLLAACVLPLTTSYAICEAFGWERGVDHTWKEAPLFKGIFTFVIIFSCIIVLIPDINLMSVMLFAQFINGILLPVLLVFMITLVNDKRIMGAYTNGRLANILSWLTIIIVVIFTATLLVMQILGIG